MYTSYTKKKRPLFRRLLRWSFFSTLAVTLLSMLVLAFLSRQAIYNRFVRFPKEAAAWNYIRAVRQPVTMDDGWHEYVGNCHSHSYLSHDSEVPFETILEALKRAGHDFIFMSDHTDENIADYSVQWKGLHDGKLFVRGFEMDYGFMPWHLPDDTRLKKDEKPEVLAKQIGDLGGLLFFAHTEEERLWDLPELNGMEIYNLHTDTKDEDGNFYLALLADIVLSVRKYPDQVVRLLYDPQPAILARWDELNKTRKIVGIQGTDAHQNNGVRAIYTAEDTLRVEDTSPALLAEFKLNVATRGLLRLFFGDFAAGDKVFGFELAPYERMVRYSATHILANELTEEALCASLKQGRAFVAFDMIASARDFVFFAEDGPLKAVMGEALPLTDSVRLRAASPHVGRIKVLRDGAVVYEVVGSQLDFKPTERGNYRVEVELRIVGDWVPWIYSNPLRLE
jgi:hypothetical protein